jgi:hypothetical protein
MEINLMTLAEMYTMKGTAHQLQRKVTRYHNTDVLKHVA